MLIFNRLSIFMLVLSFCDLCINGEVSNLESSAVNTSDSFKELELQAENACKDNTWCWNGGTCENGVCKCLSGTSGAFCEVVEGCENKEEQGRKCGNPDNVYCIFNVTSKEPYCRCANLDHLYDPYYKTCKECNCGPETIAQCSFVRGKQKCSCIEGFGVLKENNVETWCQQCWCGPHSDGCVFHTRGNKSCNCHPGFSAEDSSWGKCVECNCGEHGNCSIYYSTKKCECEKGFKDRDGVCMECDCGNDGECNWHDDDLGEKYCTCKQGYGVNNGKCVGCDCYLGKDPVTCTFPDGIKKCSCPEGYEDINSNCTDINECLNQTACPAHADCKNTPGSYECTCRSGFRTIYEQDNSTQIPPEKEGSQEEPESGKIIACEDINECVESNVCIHNDTTSCINTIGSYICLCKEGLTILPGESSAENGCIKVETKDYTTLYTVLAVVFGLIFIGASGYFVYRMYRR